MEKKPSTRPPSHFFLKYLRAFGAEQNRYQVVAATLAFFFVAITGLFAHISLEKIKHGIDNDNQKFIESALKTTYGALNIWVDGLRTYTEQFANDPALVALVEKQLKLARDKSTLQANPTLAELRSLYDSKELISGKGFFVISPDYISIASRRDSNIGTKNIIAQIHPNAMKKVFSGHSVLIAPLSSDVPLAKSADTPSAKELTMFVATPVYNKNNKIIAALTIRIDPEQSFSRITSLTGSAYKGVTYAFGRDGIPFSSNASVNSPSAVHIRRSLSKILNRPATEQGDPASFLIAAPEKYLSHNGNTVLGTFIWDKQLGMGLASEIDYKAAMQHYYQPRNTILVLFLSTVAMALLIVTVIVFLVRNNNMRLQHANDELEEAVANRTRELTLTNRSLVKAKNELDAILTSIPDAVISTNEAGQIISANRQSSTLLGYENNELVGLNIEQLVPPRLRQQHALKRQEMLAKHSDPIKPSRPFVAFTKEGKEIHVEVSLNSFEEDGKRVAVTSLRDIGERLRVEEEKKQLQAQLIQATKMETIGQLTGGIAHDFNNILTSIMGFTELSQRAVKGHNEQLESYLTSIYQSSERASELVKQMLAFSRGDIGKQYPVEPYPITNEVAGLLRATSPASISIKLKACEHKLSITTDPAQLHLAIMNLLVNSKHALSGEGVIDIEVSRKHFSGRCSSCQKAIDGNYVFIDISDNGPGISPENIQRIFDPFFTTKGVGQGSGMGLSMVHGIVHNSGGHITVDSSPERGTSIKLLFPEHQLSTDSSWQATKARQDAEKSNNKGHIVVVDDEQTITAFMEDIIESWGYQATTFNHPRDALKALQDPTNTFDLIISDQTMPDMLGTELANICKEIRPDLPFILYSGYSEDVSEFNYKSLGIIAYFSKPVDSRMLREKLAALIDR